MMWNLINWQYSFVQCKKLTIMKMPPKYFFKSVFTSQNLINQTCPFIFRLIHQTTQHQLFNQNTFVKVFWWCRIRLIDLAPLFFGQGIKLRNISDLNKILYQGVSTMWNLTNRPCPFIWSPCIKFRNINDLTKKILFKCFDDV